ncbi:MAG: putative rane-associated protein [Acidobacteria bacterium]|nr:putative rane-associated protein [Acidobacteriota bacterium]
MSFLQRLSQYLLVLGIPGLFFIVLLDSAAVPMPGGPDALVILLSWQRPALFFWIALVAALGSCVGCLILYKIGYAGGRLAMGKISPGRQDWIKRKIEANSFLAVFLAVLAPPPFPTKAVILDPQPLFDHSAGSGRHRDAVPACPAFLSQGRKTTCRQQFTLGLTINGSTGFCELKSWNQGILERETGFEPATSTLARLHSTTELFPLANSATDISKR